MKLINIILLLICTETRKVTHFFSENAEQKDYSKMNVTPTIISQENQDFRSVRSDFHIQKAVSAEIKEIHGQDEYVQQPKQQIDYENLEYLFDKLESKQHMINPVYSQRVDHEEMQQNQYK